MDGGHPSLVDDQHRARAEFEAAAASPRPGATYGREAGACGQLERRRAEEAGADHLMSGALVGVADGVEREGLARPGRAHEHGHAITHTGTDRSDRSRLVVAECRAAPIAGVHDPGADRTSGVAWRESGQRRGCVLAPRSVVYAPPARRGGDRRSPGRVADPCSPACSTVATVAPSPETRPTASPAQSALAEVLDPGRSVRERARQRPTRLGVDEPIVHDRVAVGPRGPTRR